MQILTVVARTGDTDAIDAGKPAAAYEVDDTEAKAMLLAPDAVAGAEVPPDFVNAITICDPAVKDRF